MSIIDGDSGSTGSIVFHKRSKTIVPHTIMNNWQPTYRGSDVSLVGGSANRDFSAVQPFAPVPKEAVPVPVQQIKPGYTAISPNRHE